MRHLPMLYSQDMIRAKIAGIKDVTRRPLKVQPTFVDAEHQYAIIEYPDKPFKEIRFPCAPGDILYARETWAHAVNIERLKGFPWRPHILVEDGKDGCYESAYIYGADGGFQWLDEDGAMTEKSYWKPSIHMPKEAARIWDEVVSVRVERLQDITEEDAIREGMIILTSDWLRKWFPEYRQALIDHVPGTKPPLGPSPRQRFAKLWDSIYGTWDQNPWVVRIETKNISLTGKPDNL